MNFIYYVNRMVDYFETFEKEEIIDINLSRQYNNICVYNFVRFGRVNDITFRLHEETESITIEFFRQNSKNYIKKEISFSSNDENLIELSIEFLNNCFNLCRYDFIFNKYPYFFAKKYNDNQICYNDYKKFSEILYSNFDYFYLENYFKNNRAIIHNSSFFEMDHLKFQVFQIENNYILYYNDLNNLLDLSDKYNIFNDFESLYDKISSINLYYYSKRKEKIKNNLKRYSND